MQVQAVDGGREVDGLELVPLDGEVADAKEVASILDLEYNEFMTSALRLIFAHVQFNLISNYTFLLIGLLMYRTCT